MGIVSVWPGKLPAKVIVAPNSPRARAQHNTAPAPREGAFRSADQGFEEAAATLGARRMTVFRRITLPMVAPSLGAGAVLCWARALGEFGATITFAGSFPGQTETMPIAVYYALENDPDAAIALSLVLLLVSVIVLVSLRDRWLRGSPL